MRRGFVGLRRVCVAGALAGVGVLASLFVTICIRHQGRKHRTHRGYDSTLSRQGVQLGQSDGTPSSTVQVVAVLKPSDSAYKASTVPEELANLYASCVDSVTVSDSGGPVVFVIDASTTSDQVRFLVQQIRGTGQFESVTQQHP